MPFSINPVYLLILTDKARLEKYIFQISSITLIPFYSFFHIGQIRKSFKTTSIATKLRSSKFVLYHTISHIKFSYVVNS